MAHGEVRRSIEPRVMKVLVALAERRGRTVSRDDLIRDCWDGRIVGNDAINRAVSRLRRLASETGGGFTLRTIPRVGHRLEAEASAAETMTTASSRTQTFERNPLRLALLTTVLVIATALVTTLG